MKSLAFLGAAMAALIVSGCKSSTPESDGMMSGKNGGAVSEKKDGQCPFQAAASKKDGCCPSEAKMAEAKTEAKKGGCCGDEGQNVKIKDGCCKGKEVSSACADCKKACEAAGGCDAGKKCDEKACDEKPKP